MFVPYLQIYRALFFVENPIFLIFAEYYFTLSLGKVVSVFTKYVI